MYLCPKVGDLLLAADEGRHTGRKVADTRTVPWSALGLSTLITLLILALGVVLFNKVEKTFMDTV